MTLTKDEKERALESALEMMREAGAGGDDEGLEYEAAWLRMNRDMEFLLKTYPDKWVAMSKDGVVAVGDSLDEAFAKADAKRIPLGKINVQFMDTNPSPLLL